LEYSYFLLEKYIFLTLFLSKHCDIQMSLKIYNSLTKQKEDFSPVEKGKVKMYVCGMTVYSDAHIGHARTYFAFDVIRRYFQYKGYDVLYVQNITDVDDKIINAANKEGVDALEYSKRFAERCLGDLDKLGIRRADIYPKASETIPEMIEMTEKIIDNGFGYVAGGDVYFSVEKFPDYGKLSGQRLDEMKVGARIEPGDLKNHPYDFALWKSVKEGEPSWDSPWGPGRPGWHIECSAMSKKYLGLPFDIHGGGLDLSFPHHENEIAQAEAADGNGFAKYWMHIGLLTVDGEKMSKSIGNIINVKDLIAKWDPEIVRFFYCQAHYRSPPDFSDRALGNAEKGLERIHRLKERLEELSDDSDLKRDNLSSDELNYLKMIDDFKVEFEKVMDDDFNTPEAVAVLFEFVNSSNKYLSDHPNPDKALCKYAHDNLVKIGEILTLFQDEKKYVDSVILDKLHQILLKHDKSARKTDVSDMMDRILEIRQKARKNKRWDVADSIRSDVASLGFEIQDTDKGAIWRKK
jgi:cysteinyl-tRNA synthetase